MEKKTVEIRPKIPSKSQCKANLAKSVIKRERERERETGKKMHHEATTVFPG